VAASLTDNVVRLSWPRPDGSTSTGALVLPSGPSWSLVRGSSEPILGWYAPNFGEKEPSTTVIGTGGGSVRLLTVLQFDD
jgi:hypothetical protein